LPQSALSGWAERAWIGLIRVTPLRAYTSLIRVVSGIPLPPGLRTPVFGTIARRMGIDLVEAEGAVEEYRCFGELFVRPLRPGLRPVDPAVDAVVSPVDGSVSGIGTVRRGGLIQAKGIEYSLGELVADEGLAGALDGGCYLTLYLRPRDYHRIHSPIDARVVALRQVAGRLFPVKPYMVRSLQGLYVRNERLVFELEADMGRAALVCVAAAGVGNISTEVADLNGTGARDRANGVRAVRLERRVARGEEVARFNLGSTVIMVFPPGKVDLTTLAPGAMLRVGQRVGRILQPGR